MLANTGSNVELGRAIAFPVKRAKGIVGIRLSPVGVVEEKKKLGVIHDLTFGGGGVTVRKTRGRGRGKRL